MKKNITKILTGVSMLILMTLTFTMNKNTNNSNDLALKNIAALNEAHGINTIEYYDGGFQAEWGTAQSGFYILNCTDEIQLSCSNNSPYNGNYSGRFISLSTPTGYYGN